MRYPDQIKNLLELFGRFPGVGPKTAERFIFWLLKQPNDFIHELAQAVNGADTANKFCNKCFNLSAQTPCAICRDTRRDTSIICVVEDVADLFAIESGNEYRGLYHVLGGLIKPLDAVTPQELNITPLLERLRKEQILEVILALNPTIEGETTLLYLSKILREAGAQNITALGRGLPYGADLEYADSLTISHALSGRRLLTS